MKLSIVELSNIKATVNYSNPMVRDLFDTIEAQQQEIESLRNWNACEAEDYKKLIESDKNRIELEQEIERLQQWVNDLQKGIYVNCVYCGHRYGPEDETPTSMADVLKEHIEQCSEHPMSKLKQEFEQLQANIIDFKEIIQQRGDSLDKKNSEIEQLRNQMIQAARGSAGIVDLAEENVKLTAQLAAMREVITELKPSCGTCNPENCTPDCRNIKLFEMIDAAFSEDAGKDYLDKMKYLEGAMEIEAFDARQLRHDVQLLEAQTTIMKEGLDIAKGYIGKGHESVSKIIIDALSTEAGKDYHNPADVEALNDSLEQNIKLTKLWNDALNVLEQAGRAIKIHLQINYCDCLKNTLAAIDKALGGDTVCQSK